MEMTFVITPVGGEFIIRVDVKAVTYFFDILYIFATIVGFAHVLDVGTTDYRWRCDIVLKELW